MNIASITMMVKDAIFTEVDIIMKKQKDMRNNKHMNLQTVAAPLALLLQ